MNVLRMGSTALFGLALGGASLASRAQKPEEIVTKMEAIYKTAKTYECTFTMHQVGKTPDGKQMVMHSVNRYKYRAPSQFYLELKPTSNGRTITQVSNSDGKSLYVYIVERKLYRKNPAPKTTRPPIALFRSMMPEPSEVTLKMKPAATLNNRAVYVIEATPKDVMKEGKELKPMYLYIDKANLTLLKFASSSKDRTSELMITSQSVNPAFSANAFDYKLPAGAKEFVAPPRPSTPGGPGLPPLLPKGTQPKTPPK